LTAEQVQLLQDPEAETITFFKISRLMRWLNSNYEFVSHTFSKVFLRNKSNFSRDIPTTSSSHHRNRDIVRG
jgi:hypothetical protein